LYLGGGAAGRLLLLLLLLLILAHRTMLLRCGGAIIQFVALRFSLFARVCCK
jgi:hypothetical protein